MRAARLTSDTLSGKPYSDLREYVSSGSFTSDIADGRGINVYGQADLRSDALMLLAKMFVFGQGSVYYTTTHQLVAAVGAGGEFRDSLARVDHLFIDWFERDFHKPDERPYSFFQLVAVEDFIVGRKQSDLVTSFGSHCRWEDHKWWSRDFLSALCDNVIDVKVGNK